MGWKPSAFDLAHVDSGFNVMNDANAYSSLEQRVIININVVMEHHMSRRGSSRHLQRNPKQDQHVSRSGSARVSQRLVPQRLVPAFPAESESGSEATKPAASQDTVGSR